MPERIPQPIDHAELQDMAINGDYPSRNKYMPYVTRSLRRVINKAINVSPNKRFESTSQFRKSLEKVIILCDWEARQLRRGTVFRTNCGKALIRVRRDLRSCINALYTHAVTLLDNLCRDRSQLPLNKATRADGV